MNLIYISISGNTRSFAKRLQQFAEKQREENPEAPKIHLKEVHDNYLPEDEVEPFVAIVPTYLEGGNGIDSGDQEILTESLRDYIEYKNNKAQCIGIIGSGNKNFNNQYCLTAKQYCEQFSVPFLADFELRGNAKEIESIYFILKNHWESVVNS